MRTFITIAIILVMLIGGSISSFNYISSTSENLSSKFKLVENSVREQDWTKAKVNMSDVQAEWEKTKTWWSVLLNHQEIDNIDISLKRMEKYIDSEVGTFALNEISVLELLVEHITDTEAFTWRNVL